MDDLETGLGFLDADADEEFSEDFTGVTAGFKKVPEGIYRARLTDFERGVSKSGNDKFVWTFQIIGTQEKYPTLILNTSLLPNARWKVVETLEALGIDSGDKKVKFKRSAILGRECVINVVHQESNDGKIYANIDATRALTPDELGSTRFVALDDETDPLFS